MPSSNLNFWHDAISKPNSPLKSYHHITLTVVESLIVFFISYFQLVLGLHTLGVAMTIISKPTQT